MVMLTGVLSAEVCVDLMSTDEGLSLDAAVGVVMPFVFSIDPV